ncbi:Uncharacterised protein [Escherichia coli]|nr:Uncharacterised protein [Escherichia coli]
MASRLADTQNWLHTSAPSDFNGSQEPFLFPPNSLPFPLKFKNNVKMIPYLVCMESLLKMSYFYS